MVNKEVVTLINEENYDEAVKLAESLPTGPDREQIYQTLAKALCMKERFEDALNCTLQMQNRQQLREEVYQLVCDRLEKEDYHLAKDIIMRAAILVDEDFWRQKLENDLLPALLDEGKIDQAIMAVHCMCSQLCKDYLFSYLVRDLRATQGERAMEIASFIQDDKLRNEVL